METVKTTDKFEILKKRSGRYGVRDASTKKWINGDAKTEILAKEGLIKPPAKKEEPPAAEEAAAEAPAAEEAAAEAPAE